MRFFDANVIYGVPSESKPRMLVPDAETLRKEMSGAGVDKALVRREEQICAGPVYGNQLVADDVRGTTDLWGVWSIVPPHTNEIPAPENMLGEMSGNRIACWQFVPGLHRFSFHWRTLREWFELAEAKRVPILIDFSLGISQEQLLDVLEHFPELRLIISSPGVWPMDRIIRPFLSEFPNCCLELSDYLSDGGLESLTEFCGARKILFGSRFHKCHFGGMMLTLKHAGISDEDKQLIAAGNMERILGEIDYD